MISVNMLVQMISVICLNPAPTDGYVGWAKRSSQGVPYMQMKEVYALDCFDYFNNCMVGTNGVIKSSEQFKTCREDWDNQ